jgi:3-oxoacyl-[acyl-carrier protein] reductase
VLEKSAHKKSVLITGASRRIGIAADVARVMAADGWTVFTTWWTPYDAERPWGSRGEEPLDLLKEIGGQGIEADMSLVDSPAKIFEAAVAAVGPICALINVHTHDPGGGIFDIGAEEFDQHMAINVRSTYLLCQELAKRYVPESGPGRIVNFLSGPPLVGSVAYATSKGAVHWMTMSIAGELGARGITVNGINPGPTDTGWISPELLTQLNSKTPSGRISEPRDAANLVRFLCSPEGGWITAQNLQSDGGFSVFAFG